MLGINIYCYTTTPKYNRAAISAVLAGGAAVKDTVSVGILEGRGVSARGKRKKGSSRNVQCTG